MFNYRISLTLSLILVVFVTACVAPAAAPAGGEAAAPAIPPGTVGGTVAIFLVDKFTDVDNKTVESKAEYPIGEGCVIAPEGSAYGARGGGGGGSEHGSLVWVTFTAMLKNFNAQPVDDQQWDFNAQPVYGQKWEVPNYGNVLLIPVDIGDFDTATVTTQINNTFASLSQYKEKYGEEITRVVINMSWVIIPAEKCGVPQTADEYRDMVCAVTSQDDIAKQVALESVNKVMSDLSREPIDTFDTVCSDTSYFNEPLIRSALHRQWLTGVFREFVSQDSNRESYVDNYLQLDDGPLSTLLTTCQGSEGGTCPVEHVISIAAAGNEGWSFPMMPGLWNSVVSVSAEEGLGQSITDCQAKTVFCSNSAEIKEPGTHPDGVDVGIGSSYAAPRLSVLAALYLLQGGTNPCADRTDIHPPLGYMTEDGDANDSSAWQDLETAAADEKYCGNDFLQ